ncbi:MAG: ABC transporter permease [Blastocatellales bacterium]|nr:ABC transporter permease [Blastocatellales bacterium]
METLWTDLKYGLRTLAKAPAFTAVAILSLALGIGANSAIFSVANALLLRPLGYQDADRLVILWNRSPGLNVEQDWFSPGQYLDVKLDNQTFELTAVTIGGSFNLTGQDTPERVDGARVSSSLFPLFGAKPAIGRVFSAEEDQPGQPPAVILSHGFWKRRFGSDPSIIGRTITLNGNNILVVGVMSPDFSLNREVMPAVNGIQNADLLLPLPMSETARSNRGNEDYNIFARLKPGVTLAHAQADMDLLAARMKEKYPGSYPAHGGLTISVVPLLEQVVGSLRLALYILFAAVGFVLLISCANVANLLLARAAVRQKEMAVRAAVGAGRLRLLRQLLTESVVLSFAGGVAGLILAMISIRALRVFGAGTIPRLDEVGIDARVLAFTFIVSLATGVIFGMVPALRASRVDLNEVLKDGGRQTLGGGLFGLSHHRIRRVLVVFEVAVSLVLLIGAGLLIRSYQRISTANLGFNTHNVLSYRLSLPASKYQSPESVVSFHRRADEKIRQLPGVQSSGVSYSLPMSSVALAWEPVTVEGYIAPAGDNNSVIATVRIVSPGYFDAMGVPLVRGRLFTEQDTRGEPETILVDEAMAERFWPNEDPIGRRVRRGSDGPWRTVVGVIRNTKEYSLEREPPITIFYPFEQVAARSIHGVVKTASDPGLLAASLVREIQSLDPELPVFDLKTMDGRLFDALAQKRFSMLLLLVFAAFASMLAALGIYGVMTYWVNQRTHEIGVRMALGAEPSNIRAMIIRQAGVLISIGIAAGIAGAFALTRVMESMLFGVSATDALTFVLVSVSIGAVALLSSYVPARRASRVDPIVALRE